MLPFETWHSDQLMQYHYHDIECLFRQLQRDSLGRGTQLKYSKGKLINHLWYASTNYLSGQQTEMVTTAMNVALAVEYMALECCHVVMNLKFIPTVVSPLFQT